MSLLGEIRAAIEAATSFTELTYLKNRASLIPDTDGDLSAIDAMKIERRIVQRANEFGFRWKNCRIPDRQGVSTISIEYVGGSTSYIIIKSPADANADGWWSGAETQINVGETKDVAFIQPKNETSLTFYLAETGGRIIDTHVMNHKEYPEESSYSFTELYYNEEDWQDFVTNEDTASIGIPVSYIPLTLGDFSSYPSFDGDLKFEITLEGS